MVLYKFLSMLKCRFNLYITIFARFNFVLNMFIVGLMITGLIMMYELSSILKCRFSLYIIICAKFNFKLDSD